MISRHSIFETIWEFISASLSAFFGFSHFQPLPLPMVGIANVFCIGQPLGPFNFENSSGRQLMRRQFTSCAGKSYCKALQMSAGKIVCMATGLQWYWIYCWRQFSKCTLESWFKAPRKLIKNNIFRLQSYFQWCWNIQLCIHHLCVHYLNYFKFK